jgi:hypothetical protein
VFRFSPYREPRGAPYLARFWRDVGNADPNLFARRPAKKAAKKAPAKPAPEQVFLNIPYDAKVERLYSAYILGVIELGLKPRATLAYSWWHRASGPHHLPLPYMQRNYTAVGGIRSVN